MPDALSGQTGLPADAFVGRVLSHYRLEERLGGGGMGVLYRATDLKLGRAVAIKLLARHLASDETAKARFIREARAASALDHPNIATVYEVGEEHGELFIAMALYEGETLKQRLAKGRLAVDEALGILRQVLLGLEAAHGAGIVHRDIKPANVLVTRKGTVKILDFGLAKLVSDAQAQTVTEPGQPMGTVLYMSPEQLRGETVDSRSDLWSLGVLTYELLAGASPFRADSNAATVARILHDEPPSLTTVPAIPDWLAQLVSRMLRKSPAERPQSAAEVLHRLQTPALAKREVSARRFSVRWKNLRLPTALVAILSLGAIVIYLYHVRGEASARARSLLVLPFVNATGNQNTEYLSDGIAEELINNLSQLPQLRVIARTTAFLYKGKSPDYQKIMRETSVDMLVTGEVQQLGDSLTIQVDLVKLETGNQVWGRRYQSKIGDVLSVQEEITRSIAEKLRPRIMSEGNQRVTSRPTENTDAYQLYLLGQHFGALNSYEKAVDYFQRAVAIDPNFALAYAKLAQVHLRRAYSEYDPHELIHPRAEAAIEKALSLDDQSPEAHGALGFLRFIQWDWPQAEKALSRAIRLNGNYAYAHHVYGLYLGVMGEYEKALAEFKLVQQLDPISASAAASVGMLLCRLKQYPEGIATLKHSIDLEPNQGFAHYALAATCYEPRQLYDDAIEAAGKAVAVGAIPLYLGTLGALYGETNKPEEALAVIEQLKKQQNAEVGVADVYAGLGDDEKVVAWLEKAYERRAIWLMWVRHMPRYRHLLANPSFLALMRRMGFPN